MNVTSSMQVFTHWGMYITHSREQTWQTFCFCPVITFGTFCQNFSKFSLPSFWVNVADCRALSPPTVWISAWSWAALVAGSLANLGQPLSLLFPSLPSTWPDPPKHTEIAVFTRAPVLHSRSHTQSCTHSCSCLWLCGASHYIPHQPWLNLEMHPPHPPWPGLTTSYLGQVECNPGLRTPKYPCGECSKAVYWGEIYRLRHMQYLEP